MKFRKDFVTNSSSSSFICCFARIADPEKAQAVLDKHGDRIEVYTAEEVLANIKNRLNITVRRSRQSGVARATCPD